MKARYKINSEEEQFKMFNEAVDDITPQIIAMALFSQHLRHVTNVDAYRKKKVKQLFEDIKSVIEFPDVFGNTMLAPDAIEFIKKEYGIDVTEIKVRKEDTYREYQRRAKKELGENK